MVDALRSSPLWRKTLFILTYDEHGGYYDHVPPPVALAPDSIPPTVQPGESTYDGFARYGFRVPSIVVGPYVKRDYVSQRGLRPHLDPRVPRAQVESRRR